MSLIRPLKNDDVKLSSAFKNLFLLTAFNSMFLPIILAEYLTLLCFNKKNLNHINAEENLLQPFRIHCFKSL